MKHRRFKSGAIALLAVMSTLASSNAHAVTVVHSNDLLGEIEPCGCRTNPLGGMARKANFLKRLQDPSLILLDAGDLLFPTEVIPNALKEQSRLQAEYLLKAMDLTHHDAAVPGEKDFALGVDTFQKLTRKSKVKFLAANLKARNGKKFLEPHLLFKRKNTDGKTITVAVIGLVGESLTWPKELKVTPAIAAAKAEVKALRKQADYVIALTHEGDDKDQELAKAVPGIDIIIGAHTQSFFQAPLVVGKGSQKTRIYQSSFRNQYVGAIPLKKVMNDDDYTLVGLDPGYESPAQAPSAMDDLVKEFKTAVAELNSHEEARMQASVESSTDGAPRNETKFQTFPRCAECHLKQFDFWRKTPHARAFEALVQVKQSQNKDCLSCHTVGMGDPKGWEFVTRLAERRKDDEKNQPLSQEELAAYLKAIHEADTLDTPVKLTADGPSQPLRQSLNGLARSFTPVQCENCHQPGADHPFSSGYSKKVDTTQTCLKCHTAERAPEWYKGKQPDLKLIEAKRALITCPAGELSPE